MRFSSFLASAGWAVGLAGLIGLVGLTTACGQEEGQPSPTSVAVATEAVPATTSPSLSPLPTSLSALPMDMDTEALSATPPLEATTPLTPGGPSAASDLPTGPDTGTKLSTGPVVPTLGPDGAALPTPELLTMPEPSVTLEPEATQSSTPSHTPPPPKGLPDAVAIGDAVWTVELAVTADEQAQGLSGQAELAPQSGMLFIYDSEAPRSFWMPNMNFPLDIVWIGGDCLVVDIERDAPPQAPGQSLDELPLYSADGVQYVLEINAGESKTYRIGPGSVVKFRKDGAAAMAC